MFFICMYVTGDGHVVILYNIYNYMQACLSASCSTLPVQPLETSMLSCILIGSLYMPSAITQLEKGKASTNSWSIV